jgi:ubiquinol-cytochrome c reductase cytochrome b subunit
MPSSQAAISVPVDRRPRRPSLSIRLSFYLTRRTAIGRRLTAMTEEMRHRVVPNHWSNLFGVVSVASALVLLITGVFLMFFYTPSSARVAYEGIYAPLAGVDMSKALNSTLNISFEVRGGLLMRQAHHWAALLLPASIIMQLLVTFFTGGFRKPRQGSWVLLFLLFIIALVGGWSGYALPDDMLSGTGLRIVEGIVLSIPFIGTWLSTFLFGGQFPGEIIAHLYPIHVAIVPALFIVFLAVRIAVAYAHRAPQFAGPGRTEENVVGHPMWPNAAARAGGLLLAVMAVVFLIAATVTVGPIWLFGPSSPSDASAGSQPDWYTGFLDGALRLVPPGWEFVWLDRTWTPALLVPLIVVGVFFAIVVAYPFVESWISGDRREHNILDRPRNAPTRTAIGVAGITFYGTLWGAASADLVAHQFHLALETVILTFQILVVMGPALAFFLTRRICFALQKKDRELVLHGFETGRIVRLPGGEYVEVHQSLDRYARWRLTDFEDYAPLVLRPDESGAVPRLQRLRAALSRFFFEDRISPVSQTEIDAAAHGDGLSELEGETDLVLDGTSVGPRSGD